MTVGLREGERGEEVNETERKEAFQSIRGHV